MIDVLMIALQFAPVETTGAFRSIEFAKRLPSFGIRPTVLTIYPEHASTIFGSRINPSLEEDLPEQVDVRYLRETRPIGKETSRARLWRMFTKLDDTFEARFLPALKKELIKAQQGPQLFSAVYASAPPFGATMLGLHAARELNLPYILDMRDAWAQWLAGPQISRLHYLRKQRDELRAFSAAHTIVGVTPELIDLFSATNPSVPRSRFHTVTNGMGGLEDIPDIAIWADTGEDLNIGYVGSFYWTPKKTASMLAPHRYLQYDPGLEDWSYRSPLPFFRAWAQLDMQAPEVGARLRFHYVGRTPDWLMTMADEHGLADRCFSHGVLPKKDIADFMRSMNGLLGTSMKRIDGLDYCLASKSFEYLASGKPTLAFVCAGAQRRFFEEVGGAVIFDPDNPEASANKLQNLIGETRHIPINKGALIDYDLDQITAKMASLIKEAAMTVTVKHKINVS